MRILGRPLTRGLSVQVNILGPNPARIQRGFNLHCMSDLVTRQIIMHDIEAALVLIDKAGEKVEVFGGAHLKLSVLDDRYWVAYSAGRLLQVFL